jgi:hypothetical protein
MKFQITKKACFTAFIFILFFCLGSSVLFSFNTSKKLEELNKLKDKNLVSEKEYQILKQEILDMAFKSSSQSDSANNSAKSNINFDSSNLNQYSVIVLPFINNSNRDNAIEMVQQETIELFENYFNSVAPADEINSFMQNNGLIAADLNDREKALAIGKAFNAQYLVSGTIKDYRSEKKFRAGGFLALGLLGGGWTLYGTCELDTNIYSLNKKQMLNNNEAKIIYHKRLKKQFKKQFGGVVQGKGSVSEKARRICIKEIFKKFIEKYKEKHL